MCSVTFVDLNRCRCDEAGSKCSDDSGIKYNRDISRVIGSSVERRA